MASCSILRLSERIDSLVTAVRRFSLLDCISRGPPIRTKLDRTRVDCATSNVNANIRGRSRTTAHVSGRFEYFRTPRATRKFFRECASDSEASAPRLVCSKFPERSPLFTDAYSTDIRRLVP